MDNMIGKKIMISGMTIEVISDQGDSWGCRNFTTREPVLFKKTVLENAVKLAKAEVIEEPGANK
jgi:hypothetical protein